MFLRIRDGRVDDVRLRIYEPPRFFEAFLRGRGYREPVDITARICGICPIAYQMSACAAIEDACGVEVGGAIRELRRLIYCGEWIESHALHVFMLHAPDILGYDSAIEMARDHRGVVERGLQIKKAGNALHPRRRRPRDPSGQRPRRRLLPRAAAARAARAGRAARARARARARGGALDGRPRGARLRARARVRRALDAGRAIRSRAAGSSRPAGSTSARASTRSTSRSSTSSTRPRCTRGCASAAPTCAARSRATRSTRRSSRRSRARRPPRPASATSAATRSAASSSAASRSSTRSTRRCGSSPPTRSPTRPPSRWSRAPAPAAAGPRRRAGCCWHRYRLDDDGTILEAKIVPPTSQNQASIEADLRGFLAGNLDLDDDRLRHLCEQAIRNHDPCISCATHFLDARGRSRPERPRHRPRQRVARRRRRRPRRRPRRSATTRACSCTRASRSACSTRWEGADEVIVVDAVALGRAARHRPPPRRARRAGPGRAAQAPPTRSASPRRSRSRARSGALPARLTVYGIEGERFGAGDELSPAVRDSGGGGRGRAPSSPRRARSRGAARRLTPGLSTPPLVLADPDGSRGPRRR